MPTAKGSPPQLADLEAAERELPRLSKAPPGRARRSVFLAAAAKAPLTPRGRGRPAEAATVTAPRRGAQNLSLGERILAMASGKTRQELYAACPNDRPNHVGIAVQRHIRAGRIQERDGKFYATP